MFIRTVVGSNPASPTRNPAASKAILPERSITKIKLYVATGVAAVSVVIISVPVGASSTTLMIKLALVVVLVTLLVTT